MQIEIRKAITLKKQSNVSRLEQHMCNILSTANLLHKYKLFYFIRRNI